MESAQATREGTQPAIRELDASERLTNRELSWLDFNDRVLQLVEDASRMPLFERLKYLAIYASNLDEFFMVRVAGLHNQVDAGIDHPGDAGLTPSETLDRVAEQLKGVNARHGRAFEELRCGPLAEHGIRISSCATCEQNELEELDRIFEEQIYPVLTPLGVGPGRPFPYISNLSLSLAVWLRDPVTEIAGFARVKVPKEVLPRFVKLGEDTFVPLEDVIARHLDELFPGMEVLQHDVFRVTRDADFNISDEADDLVKAVEDELRRRRFGEVVRLEVSSTMEPEMRRRLVDWLRLEERQVYDIEGPLDLTDLWQIYGLERHADLREKPWSPVTPPAFQGGEEENADIFAAMRESNCLVHHPYDSFATSVERMIDQAVEDPDVLAIKLTVYRTSDDSRLVPSLIKAAERGKQAVCLVELKARFDERRNIAWARALEEAGAHVVLGLPGLKTHMKALLVVRREGNGVRHYVHIGTGNYHAKTARLYEDFGLFTTDPAITTDVADLFNTLTGYSRPQSYRRALVAPEYLRGSILEEIRATIEAHENGEHARIRMKLNSLVDKRCIEALYEASQAGVPVELNARGICCLRAGVPGLSDGIRVVSVVGRFLEHSRVYSFERGEHKFFYIGSADLMPRNLDDRVELLAPVDDEGLRAELEDTLDRCFADDTFSWDMQPDGSWKRAEGNTRSVHQELMQRTLERSALELHHAELRSGESV